MLKNIVASLVRPRWFEAAALPPRALDRAARSDLRARAASQVPGAPHVPQPPAPAATHSTLPSLRGCTAIYGGSFNPPHLGHAWVCEHLLRTRQADAVWMIPVFKHASGKQLADFSHRVAMCNALQAKHGDRLQVMRTEEALGGVEETAEVVAYLQERHPGQRFVLVLGADLLPSAPTWLGWPEITRRVPIEVVPRPGYAGGGQALALPAPMSSTEVRNRLARGESVAECVPAEVARYVAEHRLYAQES